MTSNLPIDQINIESETQPKVVHMCMGCWQPLPCPTPAECDDKGREFFGRPKLHPLTRMFPPMEGKPFDDLVASINEHGQLEPITLHDGVILDGRNRERACNVLRIAVSAIEFDILKRDHWIPASVTPEEFIWQKNYERRHLTEDQRAMIAMQWLERETAAAAERQKASQAKPGQQVGKVRANSPAPMADAEIDRHPTRRKLAEMAHSSEHKIRQAGQVTAAAPELVKEVTTGKLSLKKAVKKAKSIRQPVAPSVKKACGNKSDAWRMTFRSHWDHGTENDHIWALNWVSILARDLKPSGAKPSKLKRGRRRRS